MLLVLSESSNQQPLITRAIFSQLKVLDVYLVTSALEELQCDRQISGKFEEITVVLDNSYRRSHRKLQLASNGARIAEHIKYVLL